MISAVIKFEVNMLVMNHIPWLTMGTMNSSHMINGSLQLARTVSLLQKHATMLPCSLSEYQPDRHNPFLKGGRRAMSCGNRIRIMAFALVLVLTFFIFAIPAVYAQNEVIPQAPNTVNDAKETYRLRVENVQYGRVEVSLDAGQHFILLGRVMHAATVPAADKTALKSGELLRSSEDGLAVSISPGFAVKIRPVQPAGAVSTKSGPKTRDAEIITTLSTDRGIFAKLLPLPGSPAMLQLPDHSPGAFPEGYSLSQSDAIVIVASLTTPPPILVGPELPQNEAERATVWKHATRALFESIAASYNETAISRAMAEKRKVVSGTLNLKPTLPTDEPDPITAITYAIDEVVVCARTTAPYLFGWDTGTVNDGEHVIEVRALSASGNVITRSRYLVVINNKK